MGLWDLFRPRKPDPDPRPGEGGYFAPRGPVGEDGYPGSTGLTRHFRGASPRAVKLRADTVVGITPVTQARDEMQLNSPAEFYGGQPDRTRPGYDLAGQNPLSGAARAGGHSQRDTTTRWIDAQPVIGTGTPGSQNVRNSYAQRYKNPAGQSHTYKSAPRADQAKKVRADGGGAGRGPISEPVTVQNRSLLFGGGNQTWAIQRQMPYTGRGDGARGAVLNGTRYYGTGQAGQFVNAGQGQYGQARLAGPRHRPTVFTEPAPWSTSYYDTTASTGTPDTPGHGGQAPDMVYVSPEAGRAGNSTGRRG